MDVDKYTFGVALFASLGTFLYVSEIPKHEISAGL